MLHMHKVNVGTKFTVATPLDPSPWNETSRESWKYTWDKSMFVVSNDRMRVSLASPAAELSCSI
jgi:hypothetical protein